MDEQLLIQCGLSQNQARTYRALILRKSLRPAELGKLIGESRTNCYALLDKLVELGLATKTDENKKFTYYPASPLAIKRLVEKKQNEIEEQLQKLENKMPQMMSAYQLGGDAPKVTHAKGKEELEKLYRIQLEQPGRELYFMRSKADIPYFGLTKMSEIRKLSAEYGKKRYGIIPIAFYHRSNKAKDIRAGNLQRAWLRNNEYDSPVEWAVSGDVVQAILLSEQGYGISIEHPVIAESFREILKLLHHYIKLRPDYEQVLKESKFDMIPDGPAS